MGMIILAVALAVFLLVWFLVDMTRMLVLPILAIVWTSIQRIYEYIASPHGHAD